VSGEAPKARTGQSAVAHGSRLVVFGGWDYSDSYSSSKVYNDVSVLDTGKY
jgi:N-acetylneuraminic acid mutarotase